MMVTNKSHLYDLIDLYALTIASIDPILDVFFRIFTLKFIRYVKV